MSEARAVFQACWACQRECRAIAAGRIAGVDPSENGSGRRLWRPEKLPRVLDYVADFALVGRAALRGETLAGQLFELRYEQGREVAEVRRRLQMGWRGYVGLTLRVEAQVGAALVREGLYPTARYFREPWESEKRR